MLNPCSGWFQMPNTPERIPQLRLNFGGAFLAGLPATNATAYVTEINSSIGHIRHEFRSKSTQRPKMIADSYGNQVAPALKAAESKRRVRGIRTPELIIFDREPLHVRRQFLV